MGLARTETGLLVAAERVNVTGDLHVRGGLSVEGDVNAPVIASLTADRDALLEWKAGAEVSLGELGEWKAKAEEFLELLGFNVPSILNCNHADHDGVYAINTGTVPPFNAVCFQDESGNWWMEFLVIRDSYTPTTSAIGELIYRVSMRGDGGRKFGRGEQDGINTQLATLSPLCRRPHKFIHTLLPVIALAQCPSCVIACGWARRVRLAALPFIIRCAFQGMNLTSKLSDTNINAAISTDLTGYLHTYVGLRVAALMDE